MLSDNQLSNELYMNPMPIEPRYARGGKVKKSKLTYAHMAPHELDVLDHLQGEKEINKKNKVRSYQSLEHLLSNPHIRKKVMHMAMQHKANGGVIESGEDSDHEAHETIGAKDIDSKKYIDLLLQKMKLAPERMTPQELAVLKRAGVHGDRELAAIGPHTHQFLDKMAGHKTHNQTTGMPEYWSLKEALGGLWDGIKSKAGQAVDFIKKEAPGALRGIAHAVAPQIGGALNKKLGGYFGKGSALGGGLQKLVNYGTKAAQGMAQKGGMSNAGQMIGKGLAGAIGNRSLTSGLNSAARMGSKLGEHSAAGALSGAALARKQGGGYGHMATNAYRGATNQRLVRPDEYANGQGLRSAAAQGLGKGINSALGGNSFGQSVRAGMHQGAGAYGARDNRAYQQQRTRDQAMQLPQKPEPDYDTGNLFG